MTIGQRIAQNRKNLGLSQEALGEKLGVSRQSIYKWESDAALPEIDKLITLSKLFGLSVGALLGVEEEAAEADKPREPAPDLTESQLKMVEEIVQRYLSSLPQPQPKKRRGFLRAAAALCILFAAWQLYTKLDAVEGQYSQLTNQVEYVQRNVENQINGISTRVENILKAQNDLTADYETAIAGADLAANRVTFSFRAVPKTFTAGPLAYLEITSGGVTETFGPFAAENNQTFRGEGTVTLTDEITLSVVFETEGVRSTQLLDEYSYLYTGSLPELSVESHFWRLQLETPYVLTLPNKYNDGQIVYTRPPSPGKQLAADQPSAEAAEVRVGLFKNQELVAWAEPTEKPSSYHGFEDCDFYRFPELTLPLTEEDTLCAAAVITDQYGRTIVIQDNLCIVAEEGTLLEWPESGSVGYPTDDWKFD